MVNQQVIDVIFPVFSDHKHGFFGYVERDWTNLETVLTFVYTVIRRVSLYSKSSGFMPPMHVNSKEKIAQMWVSREQNLGPVWPGRSRSKMKIEIFTWSAWPVTRKLQIFQSIPLARQLLFYSALWACIVPKNNGNACPQKRWACVVPSVVSMHSSKSAAECGLKCIFVFTFIPVWRYSIWSSERDDFGSVWTIFRPALI